MTTPFTLVSCSSRRADRPTASCVAAWWFHPNVDAFAVRCANVDRADRAETYNSPQMIG